MSDPVPSPAVESMNIKVLRERAWLYRSITICIWVGMVAIATGIWVGLRIKHRVDAVATSIGDTAGAIRSSINDLSAELIKASAEQRDTQRQDLQNAIQELRAARDEVHQVREVERQPEHQPEGQSIARRAIRDPSADLVRSRYGAQSSSAQLPAEPATATPRPAAVPLTEEDRLAREERIRRFREEAEAKRLAATNAPSVR